MGLELVIGLVLLLLLGLIIWKLFFNSADKDFFEAQKKDLQSKILVLEQDNKNKEQDLVKLRVVEKNQEEKISVLQVQIQSEKENTVRIESQIQNTQKEVVRLETENKNVVQELKTVEEKLKNLQEDQSEKEGKGKALFVQNTKLEEENKTLRTENADIKKRITEFESTKNQREKEFLEKIEKLEHSRDIFEKEKSRVEKEDEQKRQKAQELRDRVWNEHENMVLSELRDICSLPEIGFVSYENTSLPAEFDGRIKPDFLIRFLEQYIVFDAKAVKPESKNSPQNYFNDQVKSTAKKYCSKDYIYPVVFFILPEDQVMEMKKRSVFESGISFFALSKTSLLPVLSLLKKITEYDNIKEFDPQDREQIVSLFANYDRHISYQNAANLVLAKKSIELMSSKESLPQNFQEEILTQKQKMKDFSVTPTEIKKFSSAQVQVKEIKKITDPDPQIEKKEVEEVEKLF